MPELTGAPDRIPAAEDEITYGALLAMIAGLAALVVGVLGACLLILRPALPRDDARSTRAGLASLVPHLPPNPVLDAYPGAQRQAWEEQSTIQLRDGPDSGQANAPQGAMPIDAAMRVLIQRHAVINPTAYGSAVEPGPPPPAAPTEAVQP